MIKKIKVSIQILKAHFFNKRIPIMANLLLTNRCNLNCFYCFVDVYNRNIKEISYDEVVTIIDDLYDIGTRVFVLLGGEPLIRKDIGRIINHIDKLGAMCEVITNGYLVEKNIEYLKKVNSVCVSLDGKEENNIPTRIKGVITKNNLSDIQFLIDFAKANKIMLTLSAAATYSERDYKFKHLWLSEKDEIAFMEKLYSYSKKGENIGYSRKALKYCINWVYKKDKIICKNRKNNTKAYPLIRCLRKDRSLYIDVDGKIYPCANMWGKTSINVLDSGVKEAWEKFSSIDCYSCSSLPDVDISLLLRLNFNNIMKVIKFF